MSNRLPMIPLGAVLVPHGVLPLHIFEPRYRVLMFDCLRHDRQFGVVLIERGHEVGGGDQRFGIGTRARIEEANELPDGRWFVLAVGIRRVVVTEWLPDDPYPVALVEDLPVPTFPTSGTAAAAAREALGTAERSVRRALELAADTGEVIGSTHFDMAPDPSIAVWQLLAVAPLGSLDTQRLLEVDNHVERLRLLTESVEERATLLGYGGGQE
ncbi:MAG TPA: LON peptidase substrate-binding domain-containing protein [Acidimicrobiales bacterium]|nr:LON peptidase substrate-binding domain-containing protein [Acidimicrobiales bacterium]